MPLFEYRCGACGLTEERLIMGSRPAPPTDTCTRCGKVSQKLEFPTRVALARSGMDNAPVDNLIGADADRRWADINRRQEIRDRVASRRVVFPAPGDPIRFTSRIPHAKAMANSCWFENGPCPV